jgi:hypothetical protein
MDGCDQLRNDNLAIDNDLQLAFLFNRLFLENNKNCAKCPTLIGMKQPVVIHTPGLNFIDFL